MSEATNLLTITMTTGRFSKHLATLLDEHMAARSLHVFVRRPKETTPIHELERWMACRDRSRGRGYRVKRGQLVALRQTPISASDPPSVWWPGER
jgi:hypothetical protein